MKKYVLSALLLLSFSLPAHAQIVNTETLFRNIADDPLALTAGGTVDIQQGNTQLLVLEFDAGGRFRRGAHEVLLNGAHAQSSASEKQIGNKSFGHLRYRYWLSNFVQAEAFGQLAQDRFRLISLRTLAGLGPRFIPFKNKMFEWAIYCAYFYEVERVDGSVDFPNGKTRKTNRANIASTARLDYKKLTIRQTIYAQPALNNPTNIRVLHQLDFAVAISDYLSLTWALEQTRDSIAPSDVVPYDNSLKGGLKLDL